MLTNSQFLRDEMKHDDVSKSLQLHETMYSPEMTGVQIASQNYNTKIRSSKKKGREVDFISASQKVRNNRRMQLVAEITVILDKTESSRTIIPGRVLRN